MSKDKWPDWNVYLRDSMTCVYCGLDGRRDFRIWQQLVVDHLIPRAQGGDDAEDNKVVSCARCNTLKKDQQLGTTESRPRDSAHRQVLIDEARGIIQRACDRLEEKADYDLMLTEYQAKIRANS